MTQAKKGHFSALKSDTKLLKSDRRSNFNSWKVTGRVIFQWGQFSTLHRQKTTAPTGYNMLPVTGTENAVLDLYSADILTQ